MNDDIRRKMERSSFGTFNVVCERMDVVSIMIDALVTRVGDRDSFMLPSTLKEPSRLTLQI